MFRNRASMFGHPSWHSHKYPSYHRTRTSRACLPIPSRVLVLTWLCRERSEEAIELIIDYSPPNKGIQGGIESKSSIYLCFCYLAFRNKRIAVCYYFLLVF